MSLPPPAPLSTKPAIVTNAVRLLYATLLIGAVRNVLEWNTVRQAAATDPKMASVVLSVTIATMVAVFALMVWLIFKINQGRNWARITFLVLFVVGVPMSVPHLLQSLASAPVTAILGLSQLALQSVAMAMLFGSSANPWFQAREKADPILPAQ